MFYLDPTTLNRYRLNVAFSYGGIAYGSDSATHAKFVSLGFTQIQVDTRPNDTYYVVSGPDNTGSYTSTPRDLDDLKAKFKRKQKKQAHATLRQTDWYIIRSQELGVQTAAVPGNVLTFRSAYRAASDARCIEIDSCTTVEELEALMTAPEELYNAQSQSYTSNPAALTPWPEPLAETYNYS